MLGVSRKTLYRRLEEFDIPYNNHAPLSSSELDEVIKSIKVDFPNDGEIMVQAHLLRLGFKVPRSSLRNAIHRVDHENTISRRFHTIRRRIYSVPHPNAVWHIDGNHKLIRWRLVVHAGVDGFSRMIVFAKCSDNNRAATVLESFLDGVSAFGSPMCVRSDNGGENVDIWRHMLSISTNPSCVITGSSAHNVRVERMWRDMRKSVTINFSSTFASMESEGVLDPLNDVDILFCLHYVYLPCINRCLQEFQGSWNRHSMSTEGSMSPYQMFIEGISAIQSDIDLPNLSQTNTSNSVNVPDNDRVEVPGNMFVPCDNLTSQLHSFVDPLSMCIYFGKSLYYQAIQLVGSHLQLGCSNCN